MPQATTEQRHKLNRDPIRDPHIALLEFQEDGQAAVNRAAVNNEDVTFEGNTFYKASIDVIFPETGGDAVEARLVASNVDRQLGRSVDSARLRVGCRMVLVDASNMDEPIIDTKNMLVIASASGDSERITATLGARADIMDPVPFKRTTKQDFPGVWLA